LQPPPSKNGDSIRKILSFFFSDVLKKHSKGKCSISMKISNKLGLTLGIVLLIFTIVGTIAYINIMGHEYTERWRTHTHQVIEEILTLESFLINMEAGQRGYLLTGEKEYLEPYNDGIKNVQDTLDRLKELTSDNSKQQVAIGKISVLQHEKLAELEKTITLFDSVSKEAAIALVLSGEGKKTMDDIRQEISLMISEENQLLSMRTHAEQTFAHQTKFTIIFGSIISFFVILLSGFFLTKCITKPLKLLVGHTHELSQGNYSEVKAIAPHDEIGELATAFSRMSEKIKSKEALLANQKQRLDNIIKGTNVGTWEWNIQSGDVVFNEQWAHMLGYTLEELKPLSIKTWEQLCHPEDYKKSSNLLTKHFNNEVEYYECETRVLHKKGNWMWILDRGKVFSWSDDGKPLWMYGTHQDITERKRNEEMIVHLANHDPLTGLATRRLATSRLKMAIELAKRHKELIAVFYIDIDGFKEINDVFGHNAGDAVLIETSKRFLSIVRESDTVARLGGDEFLLLVTELKELQKAGLVAEKILQSLSLPVCYNDVKLSVGASIGIAIYPDNGTETDELVTCADKAMYSIKKSGKNGYGFSSENE